jgi:ergothioneine biosynthesis protein EgtB
VLWRLPFRLTADPTKGFGTLTPLDSHPFETSEPAVSDPLAPARQTGAAERFARMRARSARIAAPLSAEDMVPQSMPDASPIKWHLAHTSWFFETFLLVPAGWAPFDPAYGFLFNSYYEALGERQPRPARGLITRPGVAEVMAYRAHVDQAMGELLQRPVGEEMEPLLDLGLAHEEQHQELMLTDLLHLFAQNSTRPAYQRRTAPPTGAVPPPLTWTRLEGGVVEIGHAGVGFAFDHEGPRHQVLLRPFELADRLVTNGEWQAFIADDGYRRPEFWLSDGWALCRLERWGAPMYWEKAGDGWNAFGLNGMEPVRADAPVTHISFFEADAFAHWAGARLPTEAEWEVASVQAGDPCVWLDDWTLSPEPARGRRLGQMFGDVWEWTASAYTAYPGYRPAAGAVGEYNGKFMSGQMVLRGGSCATPAGHVRPSYRNFFPPHQRWQFSGLRLARDV